MRRNGCFVTATDTGVGKTVVSCALALALAERGGAITPRLWKPVQSGSALGQRDADSCRLRHGGGTGQSEADIASVTFPEPLAPWMAAERAGRAINYAALVEEGRSRLYGGAYCVVEGVGGIAVPITADRLMADLAADLDLPLVIVARPTLGTVNHTLLTIRYAESRGLAVGGVVLNGVRPEHEERAVRENIRMIERFGGVPVIGVLPWGPDDPTTDEGWAEWRLYWRRTAVERLDLGRLLG